MDTIRKLKGGAAAPRITWDPKGERASELLSSELRGLGRAGGYDRSTGSGCMNSISIGDTYVMFKDGALRLDAEVKVSPFFTSATEALARKRALGLLKPVIEAAFQRMQGEMDKKFPVNVELTITRTSKAHQLIS